MEEPNQISNEAQPLLLSDRLALSSLNHNLTTDPIGTHLLKVHGRDSRLFRLRHALQRFLTSKYGHYFVIFLVSVDIAGIFADFLISLHLCEHASDKNFDSKKWERADDVLDVASLVFSCTFVAELVASVFAFGFRYFQSKFHCFDAFVIVAGFIVDVLLHGTIEEAGSLIVVGRLWRVFKIIEEFSSGAEDQLDQMAERIEELEKEKEEMAREVGSLQLELGKHTAIST